MISPLDTRVAMALTRAAQGIGTGQDGSTSGYEFEQVLFEVVQDVNAWHHISGPDQFNMSLPIFSKTGVRYEFDGVFGSAEMLYVIEAKRLRSGPLSRELVGIFIQKLIDTLIGSYDELGHFAIKAAIVSALPHIDDAARHYAAAWGVLLVGPEDASPFEILEAIQKSSKTSPATEHLERECEALASHLWRPFNKILYPAQQGRDIFCLDANRIYDASRVQQLVVQCSECLESARSLGLVPQTVTQHAFRSRR